ncbi:phage tail protein [Streptomyces olivoreticuli]|uniref:phage tail protein n=1 Tax=Streptomyces olivoreticuli TaxID=68246 RepID=UPI000E263083|nr:hypothetical protein [Streptomyces olivoreticuli]
MAGGGPGGSEAGRVHVKVLPDTSDFHRSLQRYLDRIERQARVRVHVDIDDATARGRLDDLARRARRITPVIRPDVDAGRAESRLMALARRRTVRIQARVDRGFLGNIGRAVDGARQLVSGAGEMVAASFGTAFTSVRAGFSDLLQGGQQTFGGIAGAAGAAGSAIGSGVQVAVMATVASLMTLAVVAGAGLVAVAALAAVPLLPMAAGIAALALGTDKLKDSFSGVASEAKSVFSDAASVMERPVKAALDNIRGWLGSSRGMFRSFFEAGSQYIDPLVRSLTGFADKLLPRLTRALNESGMNEFVEHVSTGFAELGSITGDFFVKLAQNAPTLTKVFDAFISFLAVVTSAFADLLVSLSEFAPQALNTLAEALRGVMNALSDNPEAMQLLVDLASWILMQFVQGLQATMGALNLFAQAWEAMRQGIATAVTWVRTEVPAAWQWVQDKTGEAWQWCSDKVSSAWQWITSSTSQGAQWVQDKLSAAWSTCRNVTATVWQAISDAVSRAVGWVRDHCAKLGELPGKFKDWFGQAKDGAVSKLGDLVSWCRGLKDKVLGAIGDAGSWLVQKGKDAVNGFISGLKSVSVGGVMSSIKDAVMGFSMPMAAPASNVMTLAATPQLMTLAADFGPSAVAYSDPFADALQPLQQVMRRSVVGEFGKTAARSAGQGRETRKDETRGQRWNPPITVNANTNADPREIGREVAWQLRIGR